MPPSSLRNRLKTALLRFGQDRLQKVWQIDDSNVSRRLSCERGMTLDDVCDALEAMGATLVLPGDGMTVVRTSLYDSLLSLAKEATEQLHDQRLAEKTGAERQAREA